MVMSHELKCWPAYFQAILDNRKKHEIREDDGRGFKEGHFLWLREYDPTAKAYSGREIHATVTCLTSDLSQWCKPNGRYPVVVMSIFVTNTEKC